MKKGKLEKTLYRSICFDMKLCDLISKTQVSVMVKRFRQ